jgi:Rnl2 family RNA ligase
MDTQTHITHSINPIHPSDDPTKTKQSFKKYSSIENHYNKKTIDHIIDYIKLNDLQDMKWYVDEKVHGANFSFIITSDELTGTHIQCAKRNGLLEPDELFYNYQQIKEKYTPNIIKLYTILKNKYPSLIKVSIFGEIFGGGYPHKNIERVKDAIQVQKGVYYCPHNDFYAFDINLDIHFDINLSTKESGGKYLGVLEARELFESCGFVYGKILFSGSFEEVLNYNNTFQTTVPEYYGLPPIENNIAEGIVIRPAHTLYTYNGSRIILKSKTSKFSEIIKANNTKKPNNTKIQQDLNPIIYEIASTFDNYINENRLNNVLSKESAFTHTNYAKISGLMLKDILEEYMKIEDTTSYDSLEKKDKTDLHKYLNNKCIKFIRDNITNNVK